MNEVYPEWFEGGWCSSVDENMVCLRLDEAHALGSEDELFDKGDIVDPNRSISCYLSQARARDIRRKPCIRDFCLDSRSVHNQAFRNSGYGWVARLDVVEAPDLSEEFLYQKLPSTVNSCAAAQCLSCYHRDLYTDDTARL